MTQVHLLSITVLLVYLHAAGSNSVVLLASSPLELLSPANSSAKTVALFTVPLSRRTRNHILQGLSAEVDRGELDPLETFQHASHIPMSYAKWLSAQGARVVPIDIFAPLHEIRSALGRVGGVLFPGGSVPPFLSHESLNVDFGIERTKPTHQIFSRFSRKMRRVYRLIKRLNVQRKAKLAVWATCLGFEELVLSELELDSGFEFARVNDLSLNAGLSFTRSPSDLKSFFTESERQIIQSQTPFYFNHENSIPTTHFRKFPSLARHFKMVAFSHSRGSGGSEMPIVAMIEHRREPIFGVQFHPEKNRFEPHAKTARDDAALRLTDRLAEFFLSKVANPSPQTEKDNEFWEQSLKRYRVYDANNIGPFQQIMVFVRD